MKKVIFLMCLLVSILQNGKTQNGWVEQTPTLYQICAFDTDCAWITAKKKYTNNDNEHTGIYRTTNSGNSWDFIEMSGYSNLSTPIFFSRNNGYIQANDGTNSYLRRSADGGQTWINVFTNPRIFYFWSMNEGWVIDNAPPFLLKRTHDRGDTWVNMGNLPSNIAVAPNVPINLKFTSFLSGWLIGTNSTNTMDYAYSTQDGGQSWTLQLARPRTNTGFQNLEPISGAEVWITRNDSFYHTSNGGASWVVTKHYGTTSPYRSIDTLKFQSSMVGFYTFENGLYKTTDGGANWTYMGEGVQFALAKQAPSMLWVVANALKKSTNSGQSFTSPFSSKKYLKVLPSAGNEFYTLSSDFFLRKTDAIQGNCNDLDTATTCHNFTVLNNMLWTAKLTNTNVLIKSSSNGGANFSTLGSFQLNASNPNISISDMNFIDINTGMLSDNRNGIYTTNDGGNSWNAHIVSGQVSINSAAYISNSIDTVIYVVGDAGNIHKSTNKGLTWTIQATGLSANLKKVFFLNPNQGWVVGTNGTILKTNNGGLNWNAIFSADADTNTLRDIFFVSPTQGWAVGDNGVILVSNDGGNSWAAQTNTFANGNWHRNGHFSAIYMFSANEGFVFGSPNTYEYGKIFRYTNLPVAVQEVLTPEQAQNISLYPNPVHDQLTILNEGQANESAFRLLDQTGRQIMSGKLNIGTNEINVSELPAGMYFVQIQGAPKAYKVIKL
jgi:photosystem II stability/assembly factor-like uncharacterized protein